MDDFDDDLFGSLLNSKKSHPKIDEKHKQKAMAVEFNEDDPLAGLLSDDDTDEPVASVTKRTLNSRSRDSKDVDSALSLSPPATSNRRRSILDGLLAKSDVAKTTEDSAAKKSSVDFVLGDRYRFMSSKDDDDDIISNVKSRRGDEKLSNSTAGSDSRFQPGPKRPATAIGMNDKSELGLPSTSYVGDSLAAPKVRQGRRGISPTVDIPAKQEAAMAERPQTSVTSSTSRSVDWLGLKDDGPVKSSTVAKQPPVLTDTAENVHRKSRRVPEPSIIDTPAPAERVETSEVGRGTNTFPAKEDSKGEVANHSSKPTGKDNFLDWFSNKTKEGKMAETKREDRMQSSDRGDPSTEVQAPTESRSVVPTPADASSCKDLSGIILDYESKLTSLRTRMAELHTKFSEESLNGATEMLDLKTKVRRLDFERQQLSAALDGLESRHKDELETLELSFKKRIQLVEDSYQRREKSLQVELEAILAAQDEKQKAWDRERADLIATWKRRVEEGMQERLDDLEKMKELHRQTISGMKKDHDLAIARLRDIKRIEVNAMTEAQSYTKSLQDVIEQLTANTVELGQLQAKVDSGRLASTGEREMMLESKDRQLRAVQEQLQKQREENEQERSSLRELIVRLEDKLHQQTIEVEEDRNRLDIDRKALEESQKLSREKLDVERAQLKSAKEAFAEEQRAILEKMLAERNRSSEISQLFVTNADPESLPRTSWTFNDIKAQAEFSAALKAINEEKHQLQLLDERLKFESKRLEAERRALEREDLEMEKTRAEIRSLAVQVKQRSEEVEEMGLAAVQTREEGYAALAKSERQVAEVHKHQEGLKTMLIGLELKERQLAEDRLQLARERKQLERLSSQLLCVQCQSPIVHEPISTISDHSHQYLAWKLAAEQDAQYLERESAFLQSLRTPSTENYSSLPK